MFWMCMRIIMIRRAWLFLDQDLEVEKDLQKVREFTSEGLYMVG